jgi:DNA-damage-inducible protein D
MVGEPDFEGIKHLTQEGAEYWSARDLSKLLGYTQWRNFEFAIKKAKIACEQVGQPVDYQFADSSKLIEHGKGGRREVNDYILSRFACYLIAQNGDPRKPEIAAAQSYFAVTTREHELFLLYQEQQERLALREQVAEGNEALKKAAYGAGVLPQFFGMFENAGYEGLYGGLDKEAIKTKKGIAPKEEILDRMGRTELAANFFRVTQTEEKLMSDRVIGQTKATETHREVGSKVRNVMQELGNKTPEEIPAEPSIKPLLNQKRREQKKQLKSEEKTNG